MLHESFCGGVIHWVDGRQERILGGSRNRHDCLEVFLLATNRRCDQGQYGEDDKFLLVSLLISFLRVLAGTRLPKKQRDPSELHWT